jgi:hypothetical protein
LDMRCAPALGDLMTIVLSCHYLTSKSFCQRSSLAKQRGGLLYMQWPPTDPIMFDTPAGAL